MIAKRMMLALALGALTLPALAASYPVSGRYGVTPSTDKGPVDCAKLRVISFNGETRTDTGGGVPAYRNVTVTPAGPNESRVVDIFTTGQIRNGKVNYALRQIDADHIELRMQPGGTLKLRRCQ